MHIALAIPLAREAPIIGEAMTDARRATTAPRSSVDRFRPRADSLKSAQDLLDGSPTTEILQASHDQGIPTILIVDDSPDHALQLTSRLQDKGALLEVCPDVRSAHRRLRQVAGQCDLVILNISDSARPWAQILGDLQEASYQSRRRLGPLFLCISRTPKSLRVKLMLEQRGARLAYQR